MGGVTVSDTKSVRMSRKAGGGKSSGLVTCFHGTGEKGMGSNYSGTTSSRKSKPKMTRKSKARSWGKKPDPTDFFIRGFANL